MSSVLRRTQAHASPAGEESMTHPDNAKRENAALRECTSTLNAAILQINASLDLGDVLAGPGLARVPCGPAVVQSGREASGMSRSESED